jgi:hypothetical protein
LAQKLRLRATDLFRWLIANLKRFDSQMSLINEYRCVNSASLAKETHYLYVDR